MSSSEQECLWRIVSRKEENKDVFTLGLEYLDGVRPDFVAGQYLTVKLPDLGVAEGKAYSISSAPYESLVTLTVKRLGRFSGAILDKKIGETITTSLPYGFFYPELEDEGSLIFVAARIGITPGFSIIKNLIKTGDTRPLVLVYSNQTVASAVFYQDICQLSNEASAFRVRSHITREVPPTPHHHGRITAKDILEEVIDVTKATFFVCGGMHFTQDIWQDLKKSGIKPEQIYTEGFF
jgi:ferredoxin-NADP reductase